MTAVKVKQRSRNKVKLNTRSKVELSSRKVKHAPAIVKLPRVEHEDWKILKTFVGIKFNDHEKKRLWPFVAFDHINKDGYRIARRANLGTFIKGALWEKIERMKK